MKYDVFISYSTKDKKVVEGLCAYLEQHKIRCFVAYRDVDKTAVWAEKIVEGLEDSRMMLVVFSENYNCSDQVNREIEIASEDKKPILTFRLTDTKFKGAKKYYLKNLNWIDAFPHPEESFGSVTNDISRLLGIKISPITREEQSNAGGGIAPIPTPVPKKKHKHTLGIALFSIVGIALLCFIIYFNEWGNKGEENPDVPDVVLVNDSINKPVEDVSIPTNVAAEKPSSQKAEKIDTAPVKVVTTEQKKTTATQAVSTPVKVVTTEQKKTTATQAVSTPVKEEKATVYFMDSYGNVGYFKEGIVHVEGRKCGYIDETGKEVTPCIYDFAEEFSEGLASVKKDGKWGYIDKTGKEVIPCEYDKAYYFSEGLAVVGKGKKWGHIDKIGNVVTPFIYDYTDFFNEGLAYVIKGRKFGFVDKTGKEIVPCIYNDAREFSEGLAGVEKGKKWGFIDKTGREVVPCIYDDTGLFHEGLASVEKDGKEGYIDKTGKVVVKFIYDFASSFSKGVAHVKKDDKWGYIDKTGKEVIPCIYDYTVSFSEGLAHMKKDGK